MFGAFLSTSASWQEFDLAASMQNEIMLQLVSQPLESLLKIWSDTLSRALAVQLC